MRNLLFAVMLLLALVGKAQPTSDVEALFAKFKAAARFDYDFPREKVYLHLDNSAYLEGDTLWYKAYVVRASSLKPTTLSRVLYVELNDADGQQMCKQLLKLDSMGTADGAMSLAMPVHAGYYEIRAYTREMVNWGEAACYSRVIPVFAVGTNPQKKSVAPAQADITQLYIPSIERNTHLSLACPRPYSMTKSDDRMLTFYPEGGNRISGVGQRLAFKLTDGRGNPVDDTISVYRADGSLALTAQPEHEGMGDFDLPAGFDNGYATVGGHHINVQRKVKGVERKQLPLPDAVQGYALTADVTAEGVDVVVTASDSLARLDNLLGLAVFNRENVCYFDTLTMGVEPVELLVPQRALRGGVNRLELFGADGRSLANRLFWVPLDHADTLRMATLDVRQNAAEYDPFSPAVVTIKAVDANKRPVSGAMMSVAVRDEQGNITQTADGGMAANLLLASEVRGYINRPDLYFVRNDAAHRRMLDLLLRVQGWQANTFDVMCGRDTFKLRQPIEDKLIVRGTVYRDNNKREPYAGVSLDLRGYRYAGNALTGEGIEGATVTDAQGCFAFESNVDFVGEYLTQFSLRENNKRRWSRLAIDRWFEPRLRPLFAPQMNLPLYQPTQVPAGVPPVEDRLFEWKDTLQRVVMNISGTAEVVARARKYKGFTGNRYTYGGGERNGVSKTQHYINVQKTWEHIKDLGYDSKLEFVDVLRLLGTDLEYDRYGLVDDTRLLDELDNVQREKGQSAEDFWASADRKGDASYADNWFSGSYENNGSHVIFVYMNNCFVDTTRNIGSALMRVDCENTKSVAFVEDNKRESAITGDEVRGSWARYAVYIYEMPDAYRTNNKKGREYRHIQGFSPATKFYSPNYRKFDLPSERDVRRTLMWAPRVCSDAQGSASVVFFTNSHNGQTLDVSVRGITADGKFISWN